MTIALKSALESNSIIPQHTIFLVRPYVSIPQKIYLIWTLHLQTCFRPISLSRPIPAPHFLHPQTHHSVKGARRMLEWHTQEQWEKGSERYTSWNKLRARLPHDIQSPLWQIWVVSWPKHFEGKPLQLLSFVWFYVNEYWRWIQLRNYQEKHFC